MFQASNRYAGYAVLGHLPRGTVYRAKDLSLKRDVLLYVPKPEWNNNSAEMLWQIGRQVEWAEPGCMPVLDAGVASGNLYVVLKMDEGRPFVQSMTQRHRYPGKWILPKIVRLGMNMLSGLERRSASYSVAIDNLWINSARELLVIDSWSPAPETEQGAMGLGRLAFQVCAGLTEFPSGPDPAAEARFLESLAGFTPRIRQEVAGLIERAMNGRESLLSFVMDLSKLLELDKKAAIPSKSRDDGDGTDRKLDPVAGAGLGKSGPSGKTSGGYAVNRGKPSDAPQWGMSSGEDRRIPWSYIFLGSFLALAIMVVVVLFWKSGSDDSPANLTPTPSPTITEGIVGGGNEASPEPSPAAPTATPVPSTSPSPTGGNPTGPAPGTTEGPNPSPTPAASTPAPASTPTPVPTSTPATPAPEPTGGGEPTPAAVGNNLATVPDLIGKPLAEAEQLLLSNRLKYEYRIQAHEGAPSGTVYEQSIPPGEQVPMGTRVTFFVAR